MLVEAGEVEVRFVRSDHCDGAPPGIIIITRNNCAARVRHFTNRPEIITSVEIGCPALVLTLRIELELNGVASVAELAFVCSAPDKLAHRVHRPIIFLDNVGTPVQAIVGELTPKCGPGVVDCDQPVGRIPFEGTRAPGADQATIQVVSECAIGGAALARNLIYVVGRRGGRLISH